MRALIALIACWLAGGCAIDCSADYLPPDRFESGSMKVVTGWSGAPASDVVVELYLLASHAVHGQRPSEVGNVCVADWTQIPGTAMASVDGGPPTPLPDDRMGSYRGNVSYGTMYDVTFVEADRTRHEVIARAPRLFTLAFSENADGKTVVSLDPPLAQDETTDVLHVGSCTVAYDKFDVTSDDGNTFVLPVSLPTRIGDFHLEVTRRVDAASSIPLTIEANYVTSPTTPCT